MVTCLSYTSFLPAKPQLCSSIKWKFFDSRVSLHANQYDTGGSAGESFLCSYEKQALKDKLSAPLLIPASSLQAWCKDVMIGAVAAVLWPWEKSQEKHREASQETWHCWVAEPVPASSYLYTYHVRKFYPCLVVFPVTCRWNILNWYKVWIEHESFT